ncbi:hypothetical protein V8G54_035334 [Vigna mungo]|uniref:Uncharacterized protein n=1 Tax=Vigna mungo TaxID=3915 RepID=A0AAQ3MEZ4_VIGMU
MKKDDCLCSFIISWILLLRGSNHAQATTEDLCLVHALKENVQTDWAAAIFENMLKVTRLESASLPYSVFISKEEAVRSSSTPFKPHSKFEKTHHVTAIKEKLQIYESDDGSEEAKEDKESEEESEADESDDNILLREIKKTKQKRRI